jgi:hypothetical protein
MVSEFARPPNKSTKQGFALFHWVIYLYQPQNVCEVWYESYSLIVS